jgi:ATP-binding cassette subfamily C protein
MNIARLCRHGTASSRSLEVQLRREFRLCLVIVFFLSLAVQGSLLLTPLLMLHLIDGVLGSRNVATLAVLCTIIGVGVGLGGLLRYLRGALLAVVAERIGRRIQLRALTASVQIAVAGDRVRPTMTIADVSELRRLLGGTVSSDLFDLVVVPGALLFLWALHPLLFAVALVMVLISATLGVVTNVATREAVRSASASVAASNADLTAAFSQRETVLGLGMVSAVLHRWAPAWLASLDRQDAATSRAKAFTGIQQLASNLQQIAVVTAAAWLVTHGAITIGSLMAANMMVALVTAPAASVVSNWRDWSHGLLAWRRLRDLIQGLRRPEPPALDPDAASGLVFRDLHVRPPGGDRVLVRDLTLRLAPGEAWALLGPNGVGKTTLLRVALGLAEPAGGQVLLDGHDTWRTDRSAVGIRIGYLPQDPQLLEGSVLDNVGRFTDAAPDGAIEAARRIGAHGIFGRFYRGYDSPAAPTGGLSGGQQRLVALARAVYGRPRLLVLDEPEAGLDAPSRAGLRDAVQAAKADGGVVLLVTHDPAPWADVLDNALELQPDSGWQAGPLKEIASCAA